MNPFNLIDPVSPREQLQWKRWYFYSGMLCTITLFMLLGYTAQLLYSWYSIKKDIWALQKNGAENLLTSYQKVCQDCSQLKNKIQQLESWKNSMWYSQHLEAVVEKIPDRVRLTTFSCDAAALHMEGQAYELEDALGYIAALNAMLLFEGLRVIELQSCCYGGDEPAEEKKLVNFIIKGKLKKY